ncbi:hypothetical protein [Streptomyces sp. NPDC059802]|uniref:hypothetical protein n=1 Tax=Streptomyces sp. NPDC059802 TaxID=3346952 RepID=UPI00364C3C06
MPDQRGRGAAHRIGPRLLWQGPGADDLADAGTRQRTAQRLARAAQAPADCGSLLVQAMVLHAMLRKHLARVQQYIAYGLLHDLNATCRGVIRTALVPHSRHHGWHHLPDEVGHTARGRKCLTELTQALTSPPVPTVAQAYEAPDRIVRLAQQIAPHAVGSPADEISAYRACQQPEEGLV